MGKRSSTKKVVVRRKPALDKQFDCPHCAHEKSIDVTLDRAKKVGKLNCRICSVNWATKIFGLSEAVDVYSDWIDRSEELRKEGLLNDGDVATSRMDDYEGSGDRARDDDDDERDEEDEEDRPYNELRARADPYQRRPHSSRSAAEESLRRPAFSDEDDDADDLPNELYKY